MTLSSLHREQENESFCDSLIFSIGHLAGKELWGEGEDKADLAVPHHPKKDSGIYRDSVSDYLSVRHL